MLLDANWIHHFHCNPNESRKLAAVTKVEGRAFSPAEECTKILELDGSSTGTKGVVKHEKREANRKVRNKYYWVRGEDEKLSSLK